MVHAHIIYTPILIMLPKNQNQKFTPYQMGLPPLIAVVLAYGLYTGVAQSGYQWQWYRVWEYIVIYDDGTYYAGDFIYGLWQTLILVALSMGLAVVFGIILAMGHLADGKIANALPKIYTTLFRNTPILVQIYIFYFLVAPLFNMDRWVVGILALSLYEASFVGEIIRGAIGAVSQNQWQAGYALNLPKHRIVTKIIFPQSVRLMIAPMTNVAINLLKHSSIVSVIAVYELTTTARDAVSDTYITLEIWIIIGALYWLLAGVFAFLSRTIERSIKWTEI